MFYLKNQEYDIRNTKEDDLDTICKLELKPDNKPHITIYDKKRHLKYINDNDIIHVTICNKKSKEIIGYLILVGISSPDYTLELRKILIDIKGKGLGRDCIKQVMHYCFRTLEFHRLWLDVYEENIRAFELYKSMGFMVEGKLRDVAFKDNEFKSMYILSMLKNEFLEIEHDS